MAPTLSIRNLSTGYGKKQVLFGVGLDVMPGEILLITGGNGSGKSTLLKAIYGLLAPWNGDAEISFRPDPNSSAVDTRAVSLNLSRGLAYLPQKNAVFADLTVEDNLRLAVHTLHDRREIAARRDEVLASFPALSALLHRKPEKMSGGERQMVALAMVLQNRPKVLMLDEPTAGLAEPIAVDVFQLISGLRKSHGFTALVVEHRVGLAHSVANRVMSLHLGHLRSNTEHEQKSSIKT